MKPFILCINNFACLKIDQYSTGLFVCYSSEKPNCTKIVSQISLILPSMNALMKSTSYPQHVAIKRMYCAEKLHPASKRCCQHMFVVT
jgi:hypothetical protein